MSSSRGCAPRCGGPSRATRCFPVIETPDFRIDLATKRATTAGGAEIKLTPTQWHLVEILVRNPDRLVSQRQLLEEVWGPSYVNQTNYLRQFMAQLRHKFEPDPAHPRYFLTEPGMGIRFLPDAGRRRREDLTGRGDCRSSARLSSSTFTAGSPRTPNARSSVLRLDEREHRRRAAGGEPRRPAVPGAWRSRP